MKQKRNDDIDIIQSAINRISRLAEDDRGENEKIILRLWHFIKSCLKYKPKHNDKWLPVEEGYIREMAGKITRKELKKIFKHRTEEALFKKVGRMKLLDSYK